ncbi:hypothetical protein [Hymenobacter sp. B1770]|uniref:hypothetical protein n=1 Tax=Hymenobacter sp. B1770 TaxID=1718788 RepID=UPI003CF0076E
MKKTNTNTEIVLKENRLDIEIFIFYFAILTIILLRSSLIGHGLTSFVDEYRYFFTLEAVKNFAEGNLKEGIVSLYSTQGRPGDAFIRLLPAIIQAGLFKIFNINTNTPASLVTAAWMNWVILIINTVLFYSIAKSFFNDKWSRVAVVMYASLVNSNIYIRHILPYDISICFFLIALLLIVKGYKNEFPEKKIPVFTVGLISGLCFVTYPGYFMAPLILGIMMIEFPFGINAFRKLILRVSVYIAGFTSIILIFELIARLGGVSYINSSQTLSATITQGDFSEGYSFAVLYLIKVERVLGSILLILLLLSFVSLLRIIIKFPAHIDKFQAQRILLTIALILSWGCYASLVFYGHKLVFYGRTLHLFMPLLILVGMYGIASVNRAGARYLLVAASLASFLIFFVDYSKVVYVKDAAFAKKIFSPLPLLRMRSNTACGNEEFKFEPFQSKYKNETGNSQSKEKNALLLVNFGYLYPIRCYRPLGDMRNRGILLVQGDYMAKFPAYQFEGYNKTERDLLTTKNFQFQIYSIKGPNK